MTILTEQGRQQFGQLYLPYRAGLGEATFESVETVKPDGTRVAADL